MFGVDVYYSLEAKPSQINTMEKKMAKPLKMLLRKHRTHCNPKENDRCRSDLQSWTQCWPHTVTLTKLYLLPSGHSMGINRPSYSSAEWIRWTYGVFYCSWLPFHKTNEELGSFLCAQSILEVSSLCVGGLLLGQILSCKQLLNLGFCIFSTIVAETMPECSTWDTFTAS